MDRILQERLVQNNVVTAEEVEAALTAAKSKGTYSLAELLASKPEKLKEILTLFTQVTRIHTVNLSDRDIPPNIINLINRDTARKFKAIPIDRAGNNLILAMYNPQDLKQIDNLRFKTRYSVQPVLALTEQIEEALAKYYPSSDIKVSNLQVSQRKSDPHEGRNVIDDAGQKDAPVIRLVNQILVACVEKGASDIHIEPYETFLRVRLRIDGRLVELAKPPLEVKNNLISRIKIMAKMKIEVKNEPQDGDIRTSIQRRPIDFRVNSLPTVHGEKIVLRILDKSSLQVDLTKLGFEEDDFRKFKDSILKPYGMVLVTGPTGSGKTTTLYSVLSELNKITDNIMTAENPVEYNLEGINQVNIREGINLNFATALRAFLRQDPDIIMVGEIRDQETAKIAVKAALTGHLMLSTLHTNSAPETIVRLRDMGMESFNLVSTLNVVTAQRLARRICSKCRQPDEKVTPQLLVKLGIHPSYADKVQGFTGAGCRRCENTGYKGRIAIHEVLVLDEGIKSAIVEEAPVNEIKRLAMTQGMRTLRQNALNHLARGETDVMEVIRNTAEDQMDPAAKRTAS